MRGPYGSWVGAQITLMRAPHALGNVSLINEGSGGFWGHRGELSSSLKKWPFLIWVPETLSHPHPRALHPLPEDGELPLYTT